MKRYIFTLFLCILSWDQLSFATEVGSAFNQCFFRRGRLQKIPVDGLGKVDVNLVCVDESAKRLYNSLLSMGSNYNYREFRTRDGSVIRVVEFGVKDPSGSGTASQCVLTVADSNGNSVNRYACYMRADVKSDLVPFLDFLPE